MNEHGLENIEFIGYRSGVELEEVIKGARFTLIPSIWYDNLPNTALESFQYSKPVIASNIGSLPELVEDSKNGYLFEAGNVEQLVEKIKLLDDDKRVEAMGMESKSKLEDRFSSEKHYSALVEIFNDLVYGRTL